MERFDQDSRLTFIHADMDAFFAAVEVLDDPSLAGKPLIIGHPGRRGVVSTASYEARKFGVHSALPSVEALRRCPQGIWRPARGARYQQVSRQVMQVFGEFTPDVEPLSLDEAFLHIEGSLRLFGGAIQIATQLRHRVHEVTGGLTVSVGIAPNKFLAKLASDLLKPDGLTVIDPDAIQQTLDPLPVEKIWGVGPRTRDTLHHIGLRKIQHLREAGLDLLVSQLGSSSGEHLWKLAHGIDERTISSGREARSISTESTFSEDLQPGPQVIQFLRTAAEEISTTLRQQGLRARTVKLKLRTGSFRTLHRSHTLDAPTQEPRALHDTVCSLLSSVPLDGEGIRLLGLGTGNLVAEDAPRQHGLFEDVGGNHKEETISKLLDQASQLEGAAPLKRARLVDPPRQEDLDPPPQQPSR